jgi:hypothetical protein
VRSPLEPVEEEASPPKKKKGIVSKVASLFGSTVTKK